MPYLNWIDDKDLLTCVDHLLKKAIAAKQNVNFNKNVIDPFSALFEIAGFEIDYDAWIISETARQAQKTLQNHIGEFHQSILGYSKGWLNKKTGNVIDLVSEENQIIAEVKNKYNTLSGGKLADLYNSFDDLVMPKNSVFKGYTAYYVAIIPKKTKRYNIEFTPSDKHKGEKCPVNDKIREIDGASFYSLVTGYEDALGELFNILPSAIEECSGGKILIKDSKKLRAFFDLAYE